MRRYQWLGIEAEMTFICPRRTVDSLGRIFIGRSLVLGALARPIYGARIDCIRNLLHLTGHAVHFSPEAGYQHFLPFQQSCHILVLDDPEGRAAFVTMHSTQWKIGIDSLNRFQPKGSGLTFCAFRSGAETEHENSSCSNHPIQFS
jgi:hypothetical protein